MSLVVYNLYVEKKKTLYTIGGNLESKIERPAVNSLIRLTASVDDMKKGC
jgi:hypothetical protein